MQYNEYTLPNGLRIIHEPTLSKVSYCGFAIDAGTRDEAENGISSTGWRTWGAT